MTADVAVAMFPTYANVSESQGGVQLLDNGNWFVGWGYRPYFTEYRAKKYEFSTAPATSNLTLTFSNRSSSAATVEPCRPTDQPLLRGVFRLRDSAEHHYRGQDGKGARVDPSAREQMAANGTELGKSQIVLGNGNGSTLAADAIPSSVHLPLPSRHQFSSSAPAFSTLLAGKLGPPAAAAVRWAGLLAVLIAGRSLGMGLF